MLTARINPHLSIIKAQKAEEHLKVDERLMELLATYHVIHLPDHEFAEKLAWCLEHCQNKFRDLSDTNGRAWYFQNEQDAALFALRWAS
jgi:hypothetical protein